MKILHICLCGPYTDGLSYQENLLTKYQKKNGHEVTIITSTWMYNNGDLINTTPKTYIDENGVKIIRIRPNNNKNIHSKFKKYNNLYNMIFAEKPDILFVHGCQFVDISKIKTYAKNNNVRIYVDNHADFSNSATNLFSLKILHGMIWKHYANLIYPYVKKYYGVLPARVDFLKNVYKIKEDKVDLLVMGCDDELAQQANNKVNNTRKKYNIQKDDFVIVTGGKIDLAKQQVIYLLEAVKQINNPNIKVLIFGSIVDELKDKVLSYCIDNISFIGWLNHEETYNLLAIANLAIYPGRHSVLWEETVGIGVPMMVKYWDGTTHVDVGGNVRFINEDSVDCIKNILIDVLKDDNYYKMKEIATSKGKKSFSYKEIACKSIEE